jgi:hypothetical protein
MKYSIVFLQDYAIHKKDDVKVFSRDLCNMLVKELGVAKIQEESKSAQETEAKTSKPKKAKAK